MIKLRSQGAECFEGGIRYRTWCEHERVELLLVRQNGDVIRTIELQAEDDNYFSCVDQEGKAGDLYRYRFGGVATFPDPASCYQPFGVHGPSMTVEHHFFEWTDHEWKSPALDELTIYELHIGTFTAEGTFRSAIAKLDHIHSLGANAIELMPIADFPGERNWGYDGVSLYAPARAYGHPDDLRALVDAAHARGLAIILDVVYNHFGPEGNYAGAFHRNYWNPRHQTPWGAGLNFECVAVRNFFAENPEYWRREFQIDGFRLDASHQIKDDSPKHILAEIAERVHASGGFVVAEDERNEARLLRSPRDGGLALDGCWADDFHHVVRVMTTGEREGYYANFRGTPNELCETIARGWLYCGQTQPSTGKARGSETSGISPGQFIYCVSNHDQVGNRPMGDRFGHIASPATYRAASALLCLIPQTPMLFMGQEWNASTPFQFFTDHSATLGKKITEGRRREFNHFAAFRSADEREKIPDPQSISTFENSKLRWEEIENKTHHGVLALYREFLKFRLTSPVFRERTRESYSVELLRDGIIALHLDESIIVVFDLLGGHVAPELVRNARQILSSNEIRFGGDGTPPFQSPTTLVLKRI